MPPAPLGRVFGRPPVSPGQLTIADLWPHKRAGTPPPGYPTDRITLWAGVDDVHAAIEAVIADTVRDLRVSMFGYDDDFFDVAIRALVDDPTKFVQLSLDKSQAAGVHEKAILAKWRSDQLGRTIAIGNSPHGAINHTKVVVVDLRWLVTGSTNWSTSGESLQNNECTITLSPVVAAEAVTELSLIHDAMLAQMAGTPKGPRAAPARPPAPA